MGLSPRPFVGSTSSSSNCDAGHTSSDDRQEDYLVKPPHANIPGLHRCKRKLRKCQPRKTDGDSIIASDPNSPTCSTSRFRMAITNLINQPPTPPSTSATSTPNPEPSPSTSHSHVSFQLARPTSRQNLQIKDYGLEIRQQPLWCKVAGTCERAHTTRSTVVPSPVIQLELNDGDPDRIWLQSPCFFMCANLYHPELNMLIPRPPNETLAGDIISSLHRVGNLNLERGYFIFNDLSIKIKGEFRLHFMLFEIIDTHVKFIASKTSEVFRVYSSDRSREVFDHTFLSHKFSYQSVQMRNESEDRTASVVQRPNPSMSKATAVAESLLATTVLDVHPISSRMPSSVSTTETSALHTTKQKSSCEAKTSWYLVADNELITRNEIIASTNSSRGAALPLRSIGTLKTSVWNDGPESAKRGSKRSTQFTDSDSRKKSCYSGLRRFSFQHLSYFPREQQPYYTRANCRQQPLPPSPLPSYPRDSIADFPPDADCQNLYDYGQRRTPASQDIRPAVHRVAGSDRATLNRSLLYPHLKPPVPHGMPKAGHFANVIDPYDFAVWTL